VGPWQPVATRGSVTDDVTTVRLNSGLQNVGSVAPHYLPRVPKVEADFKGNYRNDRFALVVHEERLALAARGFLCIPQPHRVRHAGEDVAIDAKPA